jgi:hypothetical protein
LISQDYFFLACASASSTSASIAFIDTDVSCQLDPGSAPNLERSRGAAKRHVKKGNCVTLLTSWNDFVPGCLKWQV